ncbi:hypothetical protein [Halorubellus sp. JP-L1]|uniref:helix-turn-helix transcriptional regulator n=1 Tax=Halorubellus sp. JP-L1 TaxID=2715753 RepID=UPI001F04C11A|nr:hypothetical protein [Halorubellus sp. JP-L1]
MRFRPGLVGILLLLVLTGAVVAAGTAGSDGFGSASDTGSVSQFERADPGLVVTIQLRENGNARWHVTHRYAVNGTNETRAFEQFASEVTAGERDVGVSRETFVEFAAAANATSGREMQIRNANWTRSTVENGTGTVTYSFTWTNFGRVEGDRVYVGDAFRSPDGTWFPRLYDGQRLVIRPPSGLNIVGTPPDKGLNQRALVWDGYREFEPGYLSVVLQRPAGGTPTTDPPTNATTPGGPDPDEEGLSPFLLGVGFALLLVFVGAGSYFFARWQTDEDGDGSGVVPEASDGGSSPGAAGSSDAGSATAAGASAASNGGDGDVTGSASVDERTGVVDDATTGATATATADDGDDDGIDEALLSDEERVLRLLEGNGGRMKQANIVSETGWSNAKVSQLLSGMHDDDEIQKLRIGRENLIALPEENVAEFGDGE